MLVWNAHPAEAHPAAEALGGRAVRLQEVAQRQTGQLMEAGWLRRLEQACERQLQAAMRHQVSVWDISYPWRFCMVTDPRITDSDPRIRITGYGFGFCSFLNRQKYKKKISFIFLLITYGTEVPGTVTIHLYQSSK